MKQQFDALKKYIEKYGNPTPLPCPFCGEEPRLQHADGPEGYEVSCKECLVHMEPSAWNRRAATVEQATRAEKPVAIVGPEHVIGWLPPYNRPEPGTKLYTRAEAEKGGELADLLRKVVELADSQPFTSVGHMVEHVIPDIRIAALRHKEPR